MHLGGGDVGPTAEMLPWAGPMKDCHITVKELVPIVIAATVWGGAWQGRTVQAWCDNSAVVALINHGFMRNKDAMHLARCLASKFELTVTCWSGHHQQV